MTAMQKGLSEQTAGTHISNIVLSNSTVSVASGQACCCFEDGVLIWRFVLLLLLSTSTKTVQICRIKKLWSGTRSIKKEQSTQKENCHQIPSLQKICQPFLVELVEVFSLSIISSLENKQYWNQDSWLLEFDFKYKEHMQNMTTS